MQPKGVSSEEGMRPFDSPIILRMATVDKAKFDALLTRLLQAKPAPASSIKTSAKRKAGKVIPAPPEPKTT